MLITDAQLAEILRRSEEGEGVSHVLLDLGLPVHDGLVWLRDHHAGAVKEAKAKQIAGGTMVARQARVKAEKERMEREAAADIIAEVGKEKVG
jgi:hypothetical protein